MNRKAPARDKAIAWFESHIAAARQTRSYRLPNVAGCASAAGVSLVTVLAAIRVLRDRGEITVSHGRGIVVAASPVRRHIDGAGEGIRPVQGLRNKRAALCARLLHDIFDGEFLPEGSLPPVKVLTARYGASYRTTKAVLDGLVAQGAITLQKRAYAIADFGRPRHTDIVVLIAAGDKNRNIELLTPRTQEILRSFIDECLVQKLHLESGSYDYRTGIFHLPEVARLTLHNRRPRGRITAVCILATAIAPDRLIEFCADRAGLQDTPVMLIDEQCDLQLPDELAADRLLHHFLIVSASRPGRDMGRHLLNLGHRRVAFISSAGDSVFSRNRLLGLTEAFGSAGIEDGVVPFISTDPADGRGYARAMKNMDAFIDRIVPDRYGSGMLEEYRVALAGRLNMFVARDGLMRRMDPVLKEIMAREDITAWVGMNDGIALLCQEFLGRRTTGIRRNMAVAGFDDTLEAFFHGLTSYNFNDRGVVRAVLARALVAASPRVRTVRPAGPIELPGFVSARGSTGMVAGF